MAINPNMLVLVASGVGVGLCASFSGLGGGFLMVPLLLYMGFSAQKTVGTSFLAIVILSVSALIAHNKLANVDYRAGLLLGLGGIAGAQVGAHLVQYVPIAYFKKIFALILFILSVYVFFKK
ncbi:MAG: sulfite exporter TauE/SafE family protein [Desulfobacterales bacterium]|nr:sulfite exporter TauE/SafE family protein [Desulfobacterales bacterium]MDD4071526.1 sulfite exporter TauE/SafE family protein [Desulfobacterales bacterium]MDD4391812.1 sulfite exporter TauE/SafE family protein [Desulfobacterales bacterium]